MIGMLVVLYPHAKFWQKAWKGVVNVHVFGIDADKRDLSTDFVTYIVAKDGVTVEVGGFKSFHHPAVVSTGEPMSDGFLTIRDWTGGSVSKGSSVKFRPEGRSVVIT